MTLKTLLKDSTRNGYSAQVVQRKTVYARRAHPKDSPEIVIGFEDNTCEILQLTPEQHKALARDLIAMLLTTSVFA